MKKVISMLLVFGMLLSALPMYAAAEENADSEIIASEEQSILWENGYAIASAAEPDEMPDADLEIVRESGMVQAFWEKAFRMYETEPNNDYTTANFIDAEYVVGGVLYLNDMDVFKFQLDKAMEVTVISASDCEDFLFVLFDEDLNLHTEPFRAPYEGLFVCSFTRVLPRGTYYIAAIAESSGVEYAIRLDEKERPQSHPMYRMYDPNSGEHFYSGSTAERDFLVENGWSYEGVGFNFPEEGNPVLRLYDPVYGEHLYTMDRNEGNALLAKGWQYEGVAFNSATVAEVPQYRLHNPNAKRGGYHFTGSEEERDWLISLGWIDQGIGWYSSFD